MNKVLLVNPWIYDFAAYDLWLKPWGLLKISSILKNNGFKVYFVDTLDRRHPFINKEVKDSAGGTGKFISEEVDKPHILKNIPRRYKRYGLPVESFKKALPDTDIDIILVSSGMTYWYPGAFAAIELLKTIYKDIPIVLGGTYATLAYEHALEKSGADYVIKNKELYKLSSILRGKCDFSFQNILDEFMDYEWYHPPVYAVLRLSLGCPFDCAYCAQKLLGPDFILKNEDRALEEINMLYGEGIRNFAFYDDALLFDTGYIRRYLEGIIESGIVANFYTPNGLHARFVTEEIAGLMRKANFVNPVLSLETVSDEKASLWHRKVTRDEVESAVLNLWKAGYEKGEYTIYLMLGMPGSSIQEVREGIDFIHSLGARIALSEFSPISGTRMAGGFKKEIPEEPLLQNNSIYPSFSLSEWEEVKLVKDRVHRLNASLRNDKSLPYKTFHDSAILF